MGKCSRDETNSAKEEEDGVVEQVRKKLLESLFVENVSVFGFSSLLLLENFVLKFVLLPFNLKPSQATESADIRRASGR